MADLLNFKKGPLLTVVNVDADNSHWVLLNGASGKVYMHMYIYKVDL